MTEAPRLRTLTVWGTVVAVAAAAMTALDAVLLQIRRGFFTGGFLAEDHLRSRTDSVLFVALSYLGDLAVIAILATLGFALASFFRLRPRAAWLLAAAAALFPLFSADVISYKLLTHLGDAFDLGLMFDLTGKSASEMFAVAAGQISGPLMAIAGGVALIALVVFGVNRYERRRGVQPREYRLRRALGATLALLVAGLIVTTSARLLSAELDNGLRRKPSTKLLGAIVETATDFDRDGYGIVRVPSDPAPFDKGVYPYAPEIAGNGVDEDGVGGDLPPQVTAFREQAVGTARWVQQPDVVLVVLESFRADVVGATRGGQAVTPVLDAIAARGVRSQTAYSHNGYTVQSRYHLMTGRLTTPGAGTATSLLDDFKDHGYHVGYFSGQDDSFNSGAPELSVATGAAARMFDARQAKAERYSTGSTPGSLAVPAATVLREVGVFLESRPKAVPLFLYVNFHDTHYPYQHKGIASRFAGAPLAESRIDPAHRDELFATYLDAAHYVDAAIGELLSKVRTSSGREPAVIVIGDHGESLFDDTFLGHGYALNDPQTRIPLLASGFPLQIDEPFGQTDLRAAVSRALSRAEGDRRPAAGPADGKRVFQYLGALAKPRQISFVSQDTRISFDFRSRQVCVSPGRCTSPEALSDQAREQFNELVWTWETMVARRDEHGQTW